MLNWITDQLGTASFYEAEAAAMPPNVALIDVRELMDKEGNPASVIRQKVASVVEALGKGQQVLICCDKGISRSNSIALGTLLATGIPYDEALHLFHERGLKDMNLALLHQMRSLFAPARADHTADGILVTGASGFIGRRLTAKLADTAQLLCPNHAELDLASDLPQVDAYVNRHRIKTVLHLAHPRARNNTSTLGEALQMTKNLLEVCRLNGCHLIYISTIGIFSGYESDKPFYPGKLPPKPQGVFAETKFLCEQLILHYASSYNVEVAILRPSQVYGIGMDRASPIMKFFAAAKTNSKIVTHTFRNGEPVFDFVYLDDFVDGLARCIDRNHHGVLNLGSGEVCSTREVAEKIRAICSSHSDIELLHVNSYGYNVVPDPAEARTALEWKATKTIDQGLREIWEWCHEN
jgi:UDP-glucuronate decarboxylase